MSTNHTPNYNLCQWEATDQVLREDFNEDNRKIEAALKERNLCILHCPHRGTGESIAGFSTYRPTIMFFLVGDGRSLMMLKPANTAVCYSATGETTLVNVTWTKMGLSWTAASGDAASICNKAGTEYACLHVMSME